MRTTALGMIETIGLVAAIEGADAGLKAADVHLLGCDYVRGGLVMIRFGGDVAAVQAAVDVGTQAADRIGRVISCHVIPRPEVGVFEILDAPESQSGGCSSCGGCQGGKNAGGCHKKATAQPEVMEAAPAVPIKAEPAPENRPEPKPVSKPKAKAAPKVKPEPKPLPEGKVDYTTWKVVDLRKFVRGLEGFSLTPNEIRFANKEQLIHALAQWEAQHS